MKYAISLHIERNTSATFISDTSLSENENAYVWHHIFQPEEHDLTAFSASYGLHALAIEDCLHDDQIPKVESFQLNTHLLFNSFHQSEGEWVSEEINIFIGKGFIITVTLSDSLNDVMKKLVKRITESDSGSWQQGPSWLLHMIVDRIVDEKMVALETLEEEMETMEDQLLTSEGGLDFLKVQQLRRAFLLVRKSLFHEREILNKIIRHDCEFINDTSVYVFRDVYDHVVRLFELSETCRENIKNMVELHLAMANNQMALAANNTNKTVRRLTFITTIFMPLSLLAGIGGMSEYTSMTGGKNLLLSYSLLLAGMIVAGLLSYVWLRRTEKNDTAND